jgi:hypothetical protein
MFAFVVRVTAEVSGPLRDTLEKGLSIVLSHVHRTQNVPRCWVARHE